MARLEPGAGDESCVGQQLDRLLLLAAEHDRRGGIVVDEVADDAVVAFVAVLAYAHVAVDDDDRVRVDRARPVGIGIAGFPDESEMGVACRGHGPTLRMGCDIALRSVAVPSNGDLPDRRTALRFGGGIVALAVGVGAGVVDRRLDSDSGSGGPADSPSTTTSAGPSSTTSTTTTTTSTTTVAPLVPDAVPAGVVTIGLAHMAERPREADLASLLPLLPSPDGDVTAAARARVADDFEAGDTVVLDGWVLAVSEARAAAVLALLCTGQC